MLVIERQSKQTHGSKAGDDQVISASPQGSLPSTPMTVAVAATFTAEPVTASLDYWLATLGHQAQIEFAPYNQVFQQLLDPGSVLLKNAHGLNVVLLRLADWLREDTSSRETEGMEANELPSRFTRCRLPNRMEIVHLNKHETDHLYQEIFVNHVYWRHGITLQDGACVFDVGANIGLFSLCAHRRAKDVRIHAFEPVPDVFDLLQANLTAHGVQARLHSCGLSGENATKQFTYYPNYSIMSGGYADPRADEAVLRSAIGTLLERDVGQAPGANNRDRLTDELLERRLEPQILTVPMRTLSSVFREEKIERVDLLKIDVEKSELDVLRGIEDSDWGKIRQIVMEVHDPDGDRADRIKQLLREKGFQVEAEAEQSLAVAGIFNFYCTRPETVATAGNGQFNSSAAAEILPRHARELATALRSAVARSTASWLLLLCPPGTGEAENAALGPLLRETEQWLVNELAATGGLAVIDSAAIAAAYPVENHYDPHGDVLGHVPYTDEFFAALGTVVARRLCTVQRPPFKVVVLDCDQTIWRGVCAEDGPDGIVIDPPRRQLQEFMRRLHDDGMLLCLCSKNNAADVETVFTRRADMPLRREHFIATRINWLSKSENIRALAAELKLGLNSFIFVDDNPVECAEVSAGCPDVLTLQLPADADRIPVFLHHVWAFDRMKVTAEDRGRTALYQQNRAREQYQSESLSLAEFIAGLNLQVQIAPPTPGQLARVAQLSERTNQFNCSGRRRSERELQQLTDDNSLGMLAVAVRDRFGDYGLVGVVIFQIRPETLHVDTFLLSCRVLGKGVEHRMLAKLGEIAIERRITNVRLGFLPTSRNRPALDFLESVGAIRQPLENGRIDYTLAAARAATVAFDPLRSAPALNAAPSPTVGAAGPARFQNRDRDQWIADELCSAGQILKKIQTQTRPRPAALGPCRPPVTEVERAICYIWSRLLRIEPIGVGDNFFELGGQSLLATQLVSRLRDIFSLELALRSVFEAPTVAQLAMTIENARWAVASAAEDPEASGAAVEEGAI